MPGQRCRLASGPFLCLEGFEGLFVDAGGQIAITAFAIDIKFGHAVFSVCCRHRIPFVEDGATSVAFSSRARTLQGLLPTNMRDVPAGWFDLIGGRSYRPTHDSCNGQSGCSCGIEL